jgi:hypothetical protein
VQSRIHIALEYTELDKLQSIEIFCDVLAQYQQKRLVEEYELIVHYMKTDLYKKRFDGRQLRNIVTSAMGIAQARPNGRMTVTDVQQVVSNMESFKTNLNYQMQRYLGKSLRLV